MLERFVRNRESRFGRGEQAPTERPGEGQPRELTQIDLIHLAAADFLRGTPQDICNPALFVLAA